jgi:hypothetical protein
MLYKTFEWKCMLRQTAALIINMKVKLISQGMIKFQTKWNCNLLSISNV